MGQPNVAEPQPQSAQQQAPAEGMVEFSASQISSLLSGMRPSPGQIAEVARILALGPLEVAALMAGRSGVQLTPEQHSRLVALSARESAQGARDGSPGCGDACGCSGSPTPTSSGPRIPSATVPSTPNTTEHGRGTELHRGSAGGGTVVLRHDVDYESIGSARYRDGFSVEFQAGSGGSAANTRWLQFIWREIIGIHSDGSAHPVVATIRTTAANTYDLTQGGTETAVGAPTSGNYNTDTASATDPFYEAGFNSIRTADATTIYDMPSAQPRYIAQAFAAGAVRVVSRAHFHTFLIQNDAVAYKMGINVIWTQASAGAAPVQTESVGDCGAATSLPGPIRTRFHAQYPAFNFIT